MRSEEGLVKKIFGGEKVPRPNQVREESRGVGKVGGGHSKQGPAGETFLDGESSLG